MMTEKPRHSQVVPHVEIGQMKANQVWSHLSPPQQQQIVQSLIQICQMLVQEMVTVQEVAHEPLD